METEQYDDLPTYREIVASWRYDILTFETIGSWQGDHLVLLKDGDAFGFLSIGYGSCSGCDFLQGLYFTPNAQAEVERYAARLREGIYWGSREDVAAYVNDSDRIEWWQYEAHSDTAVACMNRILLGEDFA